MSAASGRPALAPPGTRQRWLTRGVAGIGIASLLAGTGHEVPTALLPSLLTSTLGSGRRHEAALHDDGEHDGRGDDAVRPLCARHPGGEQEGAGQDRHGSLQAREQHGGPLASAQPRRKEAQPDQDWPDDEGRRP